MSASIAHSMNQGIAALQANLSQTPWATPSFPAHAGNGPVMNFVSDNEIYAEGDAATCFYKVVSGVVRTCKFLSDGRRQIDGFHVAGDVFGFESGTDHRLSAEAVSHCVVVPYRRRGLAALAAADERLAGQLFSYAMQCLERAQGHSLLLGRRGAAQKLAAFLLEQADRRPEGGVVDLAMTRQDIADYLGLTIETVSRTLSQFERDGVISLPTARRIRLTDLAALRDLNA